MEKKLSGKVLAIDKYFNKYELILLFLLVIVDQGIKLAIDKYVNVGEVVYNNFIFGITKIYNEGVSFSFLSDRLILILIITILSLIFLIKIKSTYSKTYINLGLTLILSGALGNLIDRLIYGHVVDYIKVNIFHINFPIFNFADMLITFGFLIIVIVEVYNYSKKIER